MRVGEYEADSYDHEDDDSPHVTTRYRVYRITEIKESGGYTAQYAGHEFRTMAEAKRKAEELNANGGGN